MSAPQHIVPRQNLDFGLDGESRACGQAVAEPRKEAGALARAELVRLAFKDGGGRWSRLLRRRWQ